MADGCGNGGGRTIRMALALGLVAGMGLSGCAEPAAEPAPAPVAAKASPLRVDAEVALRDGPGDAVAVRMVDLPDAVPPSVGLELADAAGRAVTALPAIPDSDQRLYYRAAGLAVADLDGDGREDIVAVAEFVTGIGPTGAIPFQLAGAYLRRGEGFELRPELTAPENDRGSVEGIDVLIEAIRARAGN